MTTKDFAAMRNEIYNWSDCTFRMQLSKAVELNPKDVLETRLLKLSLKEAEVLFSWQGAKAVKKELLELLSNGLIVFTERNGNIIPVRVIDLYFGEKGLGNKLMEDVSENKKGEVKG